MFRFAGWLLLLALGPSYDLPQTVTGTLKTGIITLGCPHRWWLQLDSPGKRKGVVALEPEDNVPAGLVNEHVEVVGKPNICTNEGVRTNVIVIESIRPIAKY